MTKEKDEQESQRPLTPRRRYSVARGHLIYICPRCGKRAHQFKDRCISCGQALRWDIRVVK